MIRRVLLLLIAFAVQPAVYGWAAQSLVVTQVGRAFSIRDARIKRGETLHFTNADEFLHQLYVRSAQFSFTSDEQEPGRSVEIRFPTPGQFSVRCEIHPKMALAVTVE